MSRDARRRPLLVGAAASAGGLVVLVACGLAVRNGRVGSAERRVLHAVNDLPQWLYRPVWMLQQVGNLVVAFVSCC